MSDISKMLRVRGKHILFQFDDVVQGGMFEERRESGLVLTTYFDDSAKIPRVATVVAVGDSVHDIKVGDKILIEALRWTEAIKVDKDIKVWVTDRTSIISQTRAPQ